MGTPGNSTKTRRQYIFTALILAIVPLIVLAERHGSLSFRTNPAPSEVSVLTVLAESARLESGYSVKRIFLGRIEAARTSDIGFELDGKVVEVLVDEGEAVSQGQLLARLDTDRLVTHHAELEAELDQTRARVSQADNTLRRLEALVPQGAASQQSLDDARDIYRALQAVVRLAEARIRSNEVELGKSELRSPFNAIVTRRLVDEGRVLSSGQSLLQVMESVAPEARIGVAAEMATDSISRKIRSVMVQGQVIPAHVKAMLPMRSNDTRTVDVILALDTDPLTVRSGDLVRLELSETVDARGFWLPAGALVEGARGIWSAYVAQSLANGDVGSSANPSHQLIRRPLEILHEDTDRVFVQGTLQEGDLVVASNRHRVIPGLLVKIENVATPKLLASRK